MTAPACAAPATRVLAARQTTAGLEEDEARPIRERFTRDIAERYERLAWWDWDHDRLFAALDDFRHMDAQEFIAKHA